MKTEEQALQPRKQGLLLENGVFIKLLLLLQSVQAAQMSNHLQIYNAFKTNIKLPHTHTNTHLETLSFKHKGDTPISLVEILLPLN